MTRWRLLTHVSDFKFRFRFSKLNLISNSYTYCINRYIHTISKYTLFTGLFSMYLNGTEEDDSLMLSRLGRHFSLHDWSLAKTSRRVGFIVSKQECHLL